MEKSCKRNFEIRYGKVGVKIPPTCKNNSPKSFVENYLQLLRTRELDLSNFYTRGELYNDDYEKKLCTFFMRFNKV